MKDLSADDVAKINSIPPVQMSPCGKHVIPPQFFLTTQNTSYTRLPLYWGFKTLSYAIVFMSCADRELVMMPEERVKLYLESVKMALKSLHTSDNVYVLPG